MVKIPSLDDLKKAGASLVDSAKSGKLVDDLKLRIENVGERLTRDGAEMPKSESPIKEQLQVLHATMKELYQLQSEQSEVLKKWEIQLGVLSKVIDVATVVDKAVASTQAAEPPIAKTEEKKAP